MAIAMASGEAAAAAFLAGRDARTFQREFAHRAARPVGTAKLVWRIAETGPGARALGWATRAVPSLARAAMALTRI
jgi:hypothetical protein